MNAALIALLAILGAQLVVVIAGVHLIKTDRLRGNASVGRQAAKEQT